MQHSWILKKKFSKNQMKFFLRPKNILTFVAETLEVVEVNLCKAWPQDGVNNFEVCFAKAILILFNENKIWNLDNRRTQVRKKSCFISSEVMFQLMLKKSCFHLFNQSQLRKSDGTLLLLTHETLKLLSTYLICE